MSKVTQLIGSDRTRGQGVGSSQVLPTSKDQNAQPRQGPPAEMTPPPPARLLPLLNFRDLWSLP